MGSARLPYCFSESATSASGPASISRMATSAPSFASHVTHARPMPLADPVTTAICPFNGPLMLPSLSPFAI